MPVNTEGGIDNLRWIISQATPDEILEGASWYDRAHAEIERTAARWGIPSIGLTAVVALISPGRRWETNIEDAEQVVAIFAAEGTADDIAYRNRDDDRTPSASVVTDHNAIAYETGIQWQVNMQRNRIWKMFATFEPTDTYTVRLYKQYSVNEACQCRKFGEVVTEMTDVYCDNLQQVVEHVYDEAIQKVNGGFIPLY